jgi:hypothetical protein
MIFERIQKKIIKFLLTLLSIPNNDLMIRLISNSLYLACKHSKVMGIIPVFNVLIKIRLIILSNPNPYPVNMKRTPPDLSIRSLNSALRDMYFDNNYNNIIAKDLVDNIIFITSGTSCLSPLPKYFNRLSCIFLLLYLCKLYKTIIMNIIKYIFFIILSTLVTFFIASPELLSLIPWWSGVMQLWDDLIDNIIDFVYDKTLKLYHQSSIGSTASPFIETIDVTDIVVEGEGESINKSSAFSPSNTSCKDDLKEIKDYVDKHNKHYTTNDWLNIIATTLLINSIIVATFFTMEYFIPETTHNLPIINDTLNFYHNLWSNLSNIFFSPRDPGLGGSSGLNVISNIISSNTQSVVIPDTISQTSSMSTVLPYYNYQYTDYFVVLENNVEIYNVMIDYFTIPENINNVDIPSQILYDWVY